MINIDKAQKELDGLKAVCDAVPMWEEKDLVLSGDGKCWRLWDWNSQSLEIDNDDVISDDAEALKRFVGKARIWLPRLLAMVDMLAGNEVEGTDEVIEYALTKVLNIEERAIEEEPK